MLLAGVHTAVDLAVSQTISFAGDVVTYLWPALLSIGALAFAVRFVRRKVGI